MIRVTAVHPDSIAAELGLHEGTELLAVNGRELEDFLDWEFLTAEEEFLLHVRQPDGEEIEYEIERPRAGRWGAHSNRAATDPAPNAGTFASSVARPTGRAAGSTFR